MRAAGCADLLPIDLSCLCSRQQLVAASPAAVGACSLHDKSLALMECAAEKCLDACLQWRQSHHAVTAPL